MTLIYAQEYALRKADADPGSEWVIYFDRESETGEDLK